MLFLKRGKHILQTKHLICSVRLFQTVSTMIESKLEPNYDIAVVGGGIIGLATAREMISRWPRLRFAVLEKENCTAVHQSGHNSGVIHAGVYYQPGSLKAKLCVAGLKRTYEYCAAADIPYRRCGKLIVACNLTEVVRLKELLRRALANGVPGIQLLETPDSIRRVEPHCTGGIAALHSPHTGIVDFARVARSYGTDFETRGGHIHLNFEATQFQFSPTSDAAHPVRVVASSGTAVRCRHVVACAGLYADRVAKLTHGQDEPRIVPFRGDYLLLHSSKTHLVNGNIYPVPDPRFPFLGVHFTPRIDGEVWLGPNAVLSLKREGYTRTAFQLHDAMEALAFPGLRRLVQRNLSAGLSEFRNLISIRAQVNQLRRFVPQLNIKDVRRGPSGVRAQALSRDGNLVDDFVLEVGTGDSLAAHVLHVRNAPSPAATSSLAIAELVADKVFHAFLETK